MKEKFKKHDIYLYSVYFFNGLYKWPLLALVSLLFLVFLLSCARVPLNNKSKILKQQDGNTGKLNVF